MARNKNPEVTINRILDAAMTLFLRDGYDNTTIQDIVDYLGDLSKGAIYHHFKSKEDIMEAIIPRIYAGENVDEDNFKAENGLEKLRHELLKSLGNPVQERLIKAAPDLMKNPKILALMIYSKEEAVQTLIEPIIKEGVEDGSIKTKSPKQLGEVFMILTNVWMNPSIYLVSKETFREKFEFLKSLLEGIGLPILDEEFFNLMEKYRRIIEESKK